MCFGDRVVGFMMFIGGMVEVVVLLFECVFKLLDNMIFEVGVGVLFNDLMVYFVLVVWGWL